MFRRSAPRGCLVRLHAGRGHGSCARNCRFRVCDTMRRRVRPPRPRPAPRDSSESLRPRSPAPVRGARRDRPPNRRPCWFREARADREEVARELRRAATAACTTRVGETLPTVAVLSGSLTGPSCGTRSLASALFVRVVVLAVTRYVTHCTDAAATAERGDARRPQATMDCELSRGEQVARTMR